MLFRSPPRSLKGKVEVAVVAREFEGQRLGGSSGADAGKGKNLTEFEGQSQGGSSGADPGKGKNLKESEGESRGSSEAMYFFIGEVEGEKEKEEDKEGYEERSLSHLLGETGRLEDSSGEAFGVKKGKVFADLRVVAELGAREEK